MLDEAIMLFPAGEKWEDKARMLALYLSQKGFQVTIRGVSQHEIANQGWALAKELAHKVVFVIGSAVLTFMARARRELHDFSVRCLLCHEPSIYEKLDDKIMSLATLLPLERHDSFIPPIPSLSLLDADEPRIAAFVDSFSTAKEMIIKPADGAASQDIIVTGCDCESVLSAAKTVSKKPFVLQPFLSPHKVVTIDFFAVDGAVRKSFCFWIYGPIQPEAWKAGLKQHVETESAPPEMRRICDRIRAFADMLSHDICLNGIFEIEFLLHEEQLFFMEVNLLGGLYGYAQNLVMPLVDSLVIPLLQHLGCAHSFPASAPTYFGGETLVYPPSHKSCAVLRALLTDMYVKQMHENCVQELVAKKAYEAPENACIESDGQTFTYNRVCRMATGIAIELKINGVCANRIVAVMAPRGLSAFRGMLGSLFAGCAFVPVDIAYPTQRVEFMLQESTASSLLVSDAAVERVPSDCGVVVIKMEGKASKARQGKAACRHWTFSCAHGRWHMNAFACITLSLSWRRRGVRC